MESETVMLDYQPSTSGRMLAAAGPVLWIAVSYVDPGKWAAAVEGGARFGFDLAWLVLFINCGAMLCQYLSAQVAIATGKNLAQICSEEYDDVTRVLIGIGAEISMIALDFSMVLGTAYGLHAVFGIDIFNCVFLTGFDAAVFPLLTGFLGNPKAKIFSVSLASFMLVYFLFGVLISQQESSLSMGGMLNKLSGENAYALMGLLGANIMPHNFYLHSSIVQQEQGQMNIAKVAMCNDHFFAILCILSGIFLVNCMLIYLAANTLYASGLVLLTLQDALSLFDQVFRSSLASFTLIVIMFFSNQVIPLTWGLGRQVITQDLFRLEIPGWLHRATIRIIGIVPALYCFWNLGVEGVFQVLVFTQVLVALLLPSSVIPLFRVALSKSIMGSYRASLLVELSALVLFVGMLGLKIVFVIEMLFGTSDWSSNLKWNIGSGLYLALMVAAFASLSLMLLLATTPLRSSGVETQSMKWDEKVTKLPLPAEGDGTEIRDPYQLEKAMEKPEPTVPLEKLPVRNNQGNNSSDPSPDLTLPETLLESESSLDLTTIHENESEITFTKPATGNNPEAPSDISDILSTESSKGITNEFPGANMLSTESKEMVVTLLKTGEDDEGSCKPEDMTKDVSDSSQSLASDGPGSFRSLSCKSDDVGSGAGSLSRIAGLGRAARRQLTVILDDFWGQLFDFHGQVMQGAKAKKLDVLLGVDSKVDSKSSFASVQLDSMSKPSTGYIPSAGVRVPDSFRTLSFNNSLKQQFGQSNVGSPLGLRQSPSAYSNPTQLLDAYVWNSSHSTLDSGERRFYSVHVPAASDGYDQQPATIHGYNLSSYLNQIAREKGTDSLKGQLESLRQNSPPSISSSSMELYGRPLGPKPQSGIRHFAAPPGFHNVPISRNSSMKSEKPSAGLYPPELVDYTNNPPTAKKFLSLPDISGLYIPRQDSSLSGNNPQLDKSVIYGQSIGRQGGELACSSASSWAGTALGPNESPSKVCRDAFSLQFGLSSGAGSLWSKQPYEQFGVDRSAPKSQDTASTVNPEVELLQSFRGCIIKLLKLEGADGLFKQNDGADEDIIARVAAREKFLYVVETRSLDRKVQIDEANQVKFMSVPNCGEGCVWGVDLIVSFGVWCIRRILDLSLMESRPELWGKYTYVLNRLQGVIELAFSKPRSPMSPCFCLELPAGYLQKPTTPTPVSNGSLPPPPSPGSRGKFTSAAMLLDTIKYVESAISSRKGRTGTAAGDVAFPKGKENLASVLKRYKRRLLNKPVGSGDPLGQSPLSRKIPVSPQQVL